MLKKTNRLSHKKDFLEIKKQGVLYHSPFFSLAVLKTNNSNPEIKQFGIIVSKKIAKEAVKRNKIKRYISEAAKENLNNINTGFKAVFLVRKEILNKKLEEINFEVKRIISKLKV